MRTCRHALAAVSLALIMAASPARAAPPIAAQVDALLEAMDARAMVDQIVPAMLEQSRHMAAQMLPAEGDEAQARRLDQVMQAQQHAIVHAMRWERLQPIYAQIYRDVFSADEVEAMIGFYQSPEGRSAMAKMPQAMQQSMIAIQPLTIELMQTLERNLQDISGD